MLVLRFADGAERGAEAYTDAVLWLFARAFDSGVIERELGRSHGELRVTIKPLQTLRGKEFFRIPIADFAGATHLKRLGVEAGNAGDPGLLGKVAIPEMFPSVTYAGDWSDTGDDCGPSTPAATLFVGASTYAFIQR